MTDTLPKPNVELLDRTLAEVRRAARRKRRTWKQETYRDPCGTAFCFAGWAIELSGLRWADTVDPVADPSHVLMPDGSWERAHYVAEELLGLTEDEADCLFSGRNELRDLSRIVRQIKQRA